jgi:hypothetical protein
MGGVLADVGRYLLTAGIVVSLGVVIGYRPDGGAAGVLAAIALVVAFGVSVSWMWTVVALVILDSATVMSLASVMVFPLTFASNVFVPARTMPGWLEAFVDNNPVSLLASAARALMNNTGGAQCWPSTLVPRRHRRRHGRVRAPRTPPPWQARLTTQQLCHHPRRHLASRLRAGRALGGRRRGHGTVDSMTEEPGPRRTETQSIETEAVVAGVVALLADPTRIPEWAPAFADLVSGDPHSGWQATKDGRIFSLRVVVNQEAGAVDYLREVAPGREGGAYVRVVPRPGGGSVVTMTLPLLPDVDPTDTATTLARELATLTSLAEQG